MKSFSIKLSTFVDTISPKSVDGAYDGTITGIASLEEAKAGDISFLGNSKYSSQLDSCAASVVLVPSAQEGHPKENQTWLRVANPSFALSEFCRLVEQEVVPAYSAKIASSAVIDPTAQIDPTAYVGEYCVIEAGVIVGPHTVIRAHSFIGAHTELGENCVLFESVTVAHDCKIGNYVQVQSGSVIGADGYGYDFHEGSFHKIPHLGTVVLEDRVEVGAGVTIDRGRFKETRVGAGTKIDNQVQLAHNTIIGKNCLLVSQCGIAGSTELGDYVTIGGQAGVAGHLKVGAQSKLGSQGGLTKDLPPKSFVTGTPAMDFHELYRVYATQRKLPQLMERVRKLEKKIDSSSD